VLFFSSIEGSKTNIQSFRNLGSKTLDFRSYVPKSKKKLKREESVGEWRISDVFLFGIAWRISDVFVFGIASFSIALRNSHPSKHSSTHKFMLFINSFVIKLKNLEKCREICEDSVWEDK
jgi:hypothetical protein